MASQMDDAKTATENLSETGGVIVTIDYQGRIDGRRGLMRPENRKAHVQSVQRAGQPCLRARRVRTQARVSAVRSERLMLDPTCYRTATLKAALTDNTHVALA